MIRSLTIKNFKSFDDCNFELHDSIVLAGPNNSGKSTMLQGIAMWKYGLDRWVSQRKGDSEKRVRRTGVPITRTEFAHVPLQEMNLLWGNRHVREGSPRTARFIEIIVEGGSIKENWRCGLEFQYANTELIYVRPLGAKNFNREDFQEFPPVGAENLDLIYVPSLSSIEREEPRRDQGLQNRLIGEGRPGYIIRNLLLEIFENHPQYWEALTNHIANLFGIELLPPVYSERQAFIRCEYRKNNKSRPLDLSSTGSGTLQVLLLLAFLYTRRASVILLDEPDVHQHVILQKQVYDLIRKIANEQNGQVIVATHSEVILDSTEHTQVIGFLGNKPRLLHHRAERDQLREALKRVTTTDILLGKEIGASLYLEGATDEKILAEWAKILNHPAQRFLNRPFIHWLGGKRLNEAKAHYFAMRAAFPNFRALYILDGDNKDQPDKEMTNSGLRILRWQRYEIENYLLIPSAIKRFLKNDPLLEHKVDEEFWKQIPPDTDLFGNIAALERVKASSEFLVPLFEKIGVSTTKGELYQLAANMTENEIHPEVVEKLDAIAEIWNLQ